jgi:hypothetical protein
LQWLTEWIVDQAEVRENPGFGMIPTITRGALAVLCHSCRDAPLHENAGFRKILCGVVPGISA